MIAVLGDLVDIKGGGTPDKKVAEYWGGEIPWASVKDFKTAELKNTEDCITTLGVSKSATNIIPAGSIITPTRMAVGKVAINIVDMAINQDLKALIIKDESILHKKYLLRYFESVAGHLEGQAKGATVKGITLDVLKSLRVPLPPLSEQKRIAAILDKADAIRRKRQQAIELANEFLRSVFLDMFGDPVVNPKGWEVKSLGELIPEKGALVDGPFGSSINTRTDYIDNGEIPVIRTKNVSVGGKFTTEDLKFMSRDKFMTVHRSNVIPGDIILTKVGTIGNVCIFPNVYKEAVLSTTGSCRIRLDESIINKSYIFHFLKHYKPRMLEISSAGVQPFLNMKHIKGFQVPVPDKKLQTKFERITNGVNKLEKSLHLASDNFLFESLSQKAFSGQL